MIERQDPQDTVTAAQAVVWTETAQLYGVLSKRAQGTGVISQSATGALRMLMSPCPRLPVRRPQQAMGG